MTSKSILVEGTTGFKTNLINWKTIPRGMKHSGLALGGIVKRNVALLEKWLWMFPLEQQSLWATVIRSKFEHISICW